MSTRRARIKAVTSLPPRKKHVDKVLKESDINNTSHKNVDTKLESTTDITEIPEKVLDIVESPTREIEKNIICSAQDVSPPNYIETVKQSPSPKSLPSINNTSANENNTFLSPRKKYSPRKTFASPIAPSPKTIKHSSGSRSMYKTAVTPQTPNMNNYEELRITDSIISQVNHNEDKYRLDEETNREAGMDGIVPLMSDNNITESIDLLKNDIVSENAEALFDPIIPLPSPSKVRPKLKPIPRLGPQRRNSIQGSASESEDESRRGLHSVGPSTPAPPRQRYDSHTSICTLQSLPNRDISRVRNDSICSTTSQVTVQPATASPNREKQLLKTRRIDTSRRMASKRRRDMSKRETLTMYDLIFCNPTSNPIVPDEDETKAMEENYIEVKKAEEEEKKVAAAKPEKEDEQKASLVPQIKLGPNGEIILDEESLVVKNTGSDRKVTKVVHEGAWVAGSGGRYKRAPRSADWPQAETVRFYRALATLGTDFTLMAQLFPDRSRKELKIKFKKEEKLNGAQVDKALRSGNGWDVGRLKDEFTQERTAAARRVEEERDKLRNARRAEVARKRSAREVRVRTSRASKAIEVTMLPGVSMQAEKGLCTAEDVVQEAIQRKKKKKLDDANANSAEVKHDITTLSRLKDVLLAKTTGQNPVVPSPPEPTPEQRVPTEVANIMPQVPPNIESGSLVVLTVNDPNTPGKKMLQTYIAQGPHKLTPVSLPTTFLNSVVGYMKKNSKRSSCASSPLLSPSSVTSQDSRASSTSVSVIQSPIQRQRHSSFTITHL